jgi:hypothetical protein
VYSTAGSPREAEHEGQGIASRAVGHVIRRSPEWVARGLGELLYRYAA